MGISMMSDFNYAMEELEELFCSAFISRTMVITGDDIETRRFLAALDVHDHENYRHFPRGRGGFRTPKSLS